MSESVSPAQWITRQRALEEAGRLTDAEIDQLLAVATLYVDAFTDDDTMTAAERMRLQQIEDILERHGRRQ